MRTVKQSFHFRTSTINQDLETHLHNKSFITNNESDWWISGVHWPSDRDVAHSQESGLKG